MPSGFAAIDTGFPDLGKYDSTEQKLQAMEDYLVQLLENLRYTLHNLGVENLNVSSVKELGDIITEPIRAEIDDPDTGLSARIDANAAAITSEVRRATGEEAALQQTADGIKAQVTDGQGNYTVLNLKSGGLYVGNAQGATKISGSNIIAGSVTANEIAANTIGAEQIVVGTIPTDTNDLTNGAGYQNSGGVTTIIGNTVTTAFINALGITAKYVKAGDFSIINSDGLLRGYIDMVTNAFWTQVASYNVNLHSYGALTLTCDSEKAGIAIDTYIKLKANNGLVLGGAMYGTSYPATYFANKGITPRPGQIYFQI